MATSFEILKNTLLKLIFRNGTETERTSVVLDLGEPAYTVDSKRLFIGDGYTPGGNPAGNKFNGIRPLVTQDAGTPIIGDIAYSTDHKTLYCFKGGLTTDSNNWEAIGSPLSIINTQDGRFATLSSGTLSSTLALVSHLTGGYGLFGSISSAYLSGNSFYVNGSNNSDNWYNAYSTVYSLSSNWNTVGVGEIASVYNTVNTLSASWGGASGQAWNSTYNTVSSLSAAWTFSNFLLSTFLNTWQENFVTVNTLSGNWQTTTQTVTSSNIAWNESAARTKTLSSAWNSSYNTVRNLSSAWSNTFTNLSSTLHASSDIITIDAAALILTPSYAFKYIRLNQIGPLSINIPGTDYNYRPGTEFTFRKMKDVTAVSVNTDSLYVLINDASCLSALPTGGVFTVKYVGKKLVGMTNVFEYDVISPFR